MIQSCLAARTWREGREWSAAFFHRERPCARLLSEHETCDGGRLGSVRKQAGWQTEAGWNRPRLKIPEDIQKPGEEGLSAAFLHQRYRSVQLIQLCMNF